MSKVTIAELRALPDLRTDGDGFELELANAHRHMTLKNLKVSIKQPLFLGFMHNSEDPTPFMEAWFVEDTDLATLAYLSSEAFVKPTEMTLTYYNRDGSIASVRNEKVKGIAYYLESSGDSATVCYRAVYALAD